MGFLWACCCYACSPCTCDMKDPCGTPPANGKPLFCGEAFRGQCCCERCEVVVQVVCPEWDKCCSFKYAFCCCEEHCQFPPNKDHPLMIACLGQFCMGGPAKGAGSM